LKFCMELEANTIESYNMASRTASEHKDAVTHKLFQDTIVEEEQHHDLFRTELQNFIDYGPKEYLLMQSIAGSKANSKKAGHPEMYKEEDGRRGWRGADPKIFPDSEYAASSAVSEDPGQSDKLFCSFENCLSGKTPVWKRVV